MGKRSDTNKAIRNIMNWADRPEWREEFSIALDSHLDPVCERIGISQSELGQELADSDYMDTLVAFVFEDLLTRHLPPDNRNIIDDYLQRRGWRESVVGRRYLQQLQTSVLSLYEVVKVSPGRYCDLNDLIRKGGTIRVYENLGTQDLMIWDQIATRVLNMNGKNIFSGGILPYPAEAADSLLKVLAATKKQLIKDLALVVGKNRISDEMDNLEKQVLQESTTAFTAFWLVHLWNQLRAAPRLPGIVNRDNEAWVHAQTRIPVLCGHTQEVCMRLDKSTDWERDHPDDFVWLWLPTSHYSSAKNQHQHAATDGDGPTSINGTLELRLDSLTLTSNSMERTKRGQTELEELLSGLIGPAMTVLQTPEQLMAQQDEQPPAGRSQSTPFLESEETAEVMQAFLDQHYRRTLDEPLPMLGNKSPRQCAKSKQGRKKVIEWLKYLENNEMHRAASEDAKPYDTRWIWQELQLKNNDQ